MSILPCHLTRFKYKGYAAAAKSLQSCLTLCDPIDSSPPRSPIPGILQVRILEWVAISFSSAWKWKVKVKSLSHVRLIDPMDCSLPGSSIHGVLQVRVLEWGAIAFSDKGLYKTQISDWKTNLSITWALASVPYPKAILPISYAIIPKRVYIYVHKNTKWKKNQGT